MLKIGLTFDLKGDYLQLGFAADEVAELDTPETIDALDQAINSLGFEVIRIGNIFRLVEFLNSGRRCDLIFNICEGMFGTSREAQVPCLLDAYRIPYVFSEPGVLHITLDKGLTKLMLSHEGIPTAAYKVISEISEIQFINMTFPLFVKPVAEGTSKGIDSYSFVRDRQELEKSVTFLLKAFRQPVLVESYLSGREFTVGVIGSENDSKAIGVLEIILNEHAPHPIYSSTIKKDWEKYAGYCLANDQAALECAEIAVDAWKIVKGKDAGRIDFRLAENGKPNLIEINPLAGLNPVWSDLPILARLSGISYHQLISSIIDSAMKRANLKNSRWNMQ